MANPKEFVADSIVGGMFLQDVFSLFEVDITTGVESLKSLRSPCMKYPVKAIKNQFTAILEIFSLISKQGIKHQQNDLY